MTLVVSLMMVAFFSLESVASEKKCVRILGYEWDGEKQSMDPAELIGGDCGYHVQAVYEPLVERDTSMNPVPVLAESWKSNKDGTVWTFYLRKGVKFHDGSEFDAKEHFSLFLK